MIGHTRSSQPNEAQTAFLGMDIIGSGKVQLQKPKGLHCVLAPVGINADKIVNSSGKITP